MISSYSQFPFIAQILEDYKLIQRLFIFFNFIMSITSCHGIRLVIAVGCCSCAAFDELAVRLEGKELGLAAVVEVVVFDVVAGLCMTMSGRCCGLRGDGLSTNRT